MRRVRNAKYNNSLNKLIRVRIRKNNFRLFYKENANQKSKLLLTAICVIQQPSKQNIKQHIYAVCTSVLSKPKSAICRIHLCFLWDTLGSTCVFSNKVTQKRRLFVRTNRGFLWFCWFVN